MRNLKQFSKNELINYFSLEKSFIKSDYSALCYLCLLLKMLQIGGFRERGKFLLKMSYDKNHIPHNMSDFQKLEFANQLHRQGKYFYPNFENFIKNGN